MHLSSTYQGWAPSVGLCAGFGGPGGTSNRKARHNITHRLYTDSSGQEHVQVQFNISGQGQRGIVSADMFKEGSEWKSAYLFVDLGSERIVVQAPNAQ